jgi:hypothetical protein
MCMAGAAWMVTRFCSFWCEWSLRRELMGDSLVAPIRVRTGRQPLNRAGRNEMVQKTLKVGTVIHVQGIPLELAADTTVNTTEGNFELMERLAHEESKVVKTGALQREAGN